MGPVASCLRRGDSGPGSRRPSLEVVTAFGGCGIWCAVDGVVIVKLTLTVPGHHRKDPDVSVAHDGFSLGAMTGSATATATACASASER